VGHVKVNCNAAVDKARGKMGIGVIVRDHEIKVLVTLLALR
jgi:hypothetical protein